MKRYTRKYISGSNERFPIPIKTTVFLAMVCTVWNFNAVMWVIMGAFALLHWVIYIYTLDNFEEVDLCKEVFVLKRKVELLWAEMPDDKRALLKRQINELLRAEGLIEPEKKSFEQRLDEAAKLKT